MRELRSVYEALDSNDRNLLMMAAAKGRLGIVKLLSNYQGLSKERLWKHKDSSGKTARDYAASRKHQEIVDFFDGKLDKDEDKDAEVEDNEDPEEREKRLQMERGIVDMTKVRAKRGKNTDDGSAKEDENDVDGVVLESVSNVEPVWPEVKDCLEAAKLPDRKEWKRDMLINRRACSPSEKDEEDGVLVTTPPVPPSSTGFAIDAALWRCETLNVLKLELPRGALSALPNEIGKLTGLSTLIIAGNLIGSLPETIGMLKNLKVLEAAENALKVLPTGIGRCAKLEVIDVSNNQLTSLDPLKTLTQLVSVHADNNALETLDGIDYEHLERLVDLSCSKNNIHTISSDIGMLVGSLESLNLAHNNIVDVPNELGQLQKKLQKLLLNDNPIKDPRVKKNMKKAEKGGRDLKEALKFLAKRSGKGKKKKKKKGKR